ncbi:MAG: hypothetical protein JO370_16715 [Paucibacter sp.]|nr:hypothetical protein [Roseateles sp.]
METLTSQQFVDELLGIAKSQSVKRVVDFLSDEKNYGNIGYQDVKELSEQGNSASLREYRLVPVYGHILVSTHNPKNEDKVMFTGLRAMVYGLDILLKNNTIMFLNNCTVGQMDAYDTEAQVHVDPKTLKETVSMTGLNKKLPKNWKANLDFVQYRYMFHYSVIPTLEFAIGEDRLHVLVREALIHKYNDLLRKEDHRSGGFAFQAECVSNPNIMYVS